jgi:ABC-type bacteriocin/lantibiotic exporter with double-glycine peptidase domain
MGDHSLKTLNLSRDLYAYIWKESRSRQVSICIITMTLAPLMMVPLEIQRRIVNEVLVEGNYRLLIWLCLAYLAVVILQGLTKFALNMVKGITVEEIARDIRLGIVGHALDKERRGMQGAPGTGAVVSMLAAEAEDVSGFGGEAFGLPILTSATILYVVGYLIWVEPMIAILAVVLYLPQALIVPVTQNSINRIARLRIASVRSVGRIASGIVNERVTGSSVIRRIYTLRIAIYLRKYALSALGNFLDALGPILVLGVGGYLVMSGTTQVGTLLVFISGLNKIADPWDQLINFSRSVSNTAVSYDMIRNMIDDENTERREGASPAHGRSRALSS